MRKRKKTGTWSLKTLKNVCQKVKKTCNCSQSLVDSDEGVYLTRANMDTVETEVIKQNLHKASIFEANINNT